MDPVQWMVKDAAIRGIFLFWSSVTFKCETPFAKKLEPRKKMWMSQWPLRNIRALIVPMFTLTLCSFLPHLFERQCTMVVVVVVVVVITPAVVGTLIVSDFFTTLYILHHV